MADRPVAVPAERVRLQSPAPASSDGRLGLDWIASRVTKLVVYGELGQAQCTIGESTYLAPYAWAQIASDSLSPLDRRYVCPDCGREFENSQGLGNHRATVHGRSSAKESGK